jgi:hypothetical protein
MVARMQVLTKLEFDTLAVIASTRPNVKGAVIDSTTGWLIDHLFPHYRRILWPVAICHGYFTSRPERDSERINERVHWSVLAKRTSGPPPYAPPNLPIKINPLKIADITAEEQAFFGHIGKDDEWE